MGNRWRRTEFSACRLLPIRTVLFMCSAISLTWLNWPTQAKPSSDFFTLTFPPGPPVGELRTVVGNGESKTYPASGVCKFPRGTTLILRLNQRGVDDAKALQGVGVNLLYGLDLADLRILGSNFLSRARHHRRLAGQIVGADRSHLDECPKDESFGQRPQELAMSQFDNPLVVGS